MAVLGPMGPRKHSNHDDRDLAVVTPRRMWILRRIVEKIGKRPTAKKFGCTDDAILRALRGLPLTRANVEKINKGVD